MGIYPSKCCADSENNSLAHERPVVEYAQSDEENESSPALSRRTSLIKTEDEPKSISIEQGLKNFPELTEEEKSLLIKNAIPCPETIGNVTIGIDAGGMGVVHMGEWNGQKVAIKEAQTHVISKEVEIYSRMKNSSGVVQFYGVAFPPGINKLCIVTKYAEKGSLTWHLKAEYQNLTWDDKLRIATQISKANAQLHQQGIYHRDLHGGNILIDDKGDAMLTDFGASTIIDCVVRNIKAYTFEEVPVVEGGSKFISKRIINPDGKKDSGLGDEQSDLLIGVMAYIAPERFRNPKLFDDKCDIYSLGVLLWELTSGHSAFARVPQDVHLAVAIMNGQRESPVEGTPVAYRELYERCWHADPAMRPTMDEILATLDKIRASMTPEQLAETSTRNNIQYESGEPYVESVSLPRPTSDIHQYLAY
ncbi:hypothetical protein BGX21_007451, partial [Mortierella sp. AD011]